MAEIVNLRRARKAKRRSAAGATAAANRLRHGRTAGERGAEALEADRAARLLDGAKLEGPELDGAEVDRATPGGRPEGAGG